MSGGVKGKSHDMQLKLLMIGDSGKCVLRVHMFVASSYHNMLKVNKLLGLINAEVGKTCLIWRFAADQFSSRTMNTIGIDYKIKNVKIDDTKIKLQVITCVDNEFLRLEDVHLVVLPCIQFQNWLR